MVLCDMRCFVLKIPWLLLRHERSSLPTDLGERPSKHVHITNAVLTQTRGGVAVVSSLIPVSASTSSSGVLTLGVGAIQTCLIWPNWCWHSAALRQIIFCIDQFGSRATETVGRNK